LPAWHSRCRKRSVSWAKTKRRCVLNNLVLLHTAFFDARMYVEPTTVQAKRVSIGFFGIPEQRIPAGGYIKLMAPDDIETYTTNLKCLDVSLPLSWCDLVCDVCRSRKTSRARSSRLGTPLKSRSSTTSPRGASLSSRSLAQ